MRTAAMVEIENSLSNRQECEVEKETKTQIFG